jgi:hypothetical protein
MATRLKRKAPPETDNGSDRGAQEQPERDDAPERSAFGQALYDARIAAGYKTVAEVVKRIHMERTNYCKLERTPTWPSFIHIRRIIVKLGLPLEYFFPAHDILQSAVRLSKDVSYRPFKPEVTETEA